jgi:hypothetical protein
VDRGRKTTSADARPSAASVGNGVFTKKVKGK